MSEHRFVKAAVDGFKSGVTRELERSRTVSGYLDWAFTRPEDRLLRGLARGAVAVGTDVAANLRNLRSENGEGRFAGGDADEDGEATEGRFSKRA